MADNLVPNIKGLVFQAKPFTAFGAAYGFTPVKEDGQNDDEEEYRAYGDENFGVVYEEGEFGIGQAGLLLCLVSNIISANGLLFGNAGVKQN
jgi:hypothetical protein